MKQLKQCKGEGLGTCKLCKIRGKPSTYWMCFLYKIDELDGCYCWFCATEIINKNSSFYPNADENGMIDVSEYPYTK
jgi:hypothetical protein